MKSNQTRNDLNYHIIFSTKNREAILTIEHFCQMREWAKEKAMEIGILIHALNGYKDHVHILLSIPPKLSVSYTVLVQRKTDFSILKNKLSRYRAINLKNCFCFY